VRKIILSSLAVIGLLLVSGSTFAADPSAAAKLFDAKCASCHAKTGKGNPSMAKMFKVEPSALDLTSKAVQDKKDEELTAITTNGKGKMPAYKGKITDPEIASLTAYIRTLASAKPAPAAEKK
jgi:cytochrome c6